MDEISINRAELRRRIKAQRRALTPQQQQRSSRLFVQHVKRAHLLRPHQRLAFYSPIGGEAPVDALIELARALHCEVHLPVIVNQRTSRMTFVPCTPQTAMRRHRWGFLQPVIRSRVSLRSLDLVFVPAVAIDASGHRMGAGAGFYDRAFHFRRSSPWRRPRLIAVVYEFQRVPRLDARAWDVPVDAVLSESGLRFFRRR